MVLNNNDNNNNNNNNKKNKEILKKKKTNTEGHKTLKAPILGKTLFTAYKKYQICNPKIECTNIMWYKRINPAPAFENIFRARSAGTDSFRVY